VTARYLITGFQAFGGDSMNPTELLLKWIQEDASLSSVFTTQLLPVEYARAHQLVLDRPDLDSFAGIFCFGLAGGRSKISLERVALNWIESQQPDNAGELPPVGPIEGGSEKVFINDMNLESLRKDFEAAGVPAEISLSAGGYVCNHLYFHLLKELPRTPVLFIHVPYLEEQVKGKPLHTPFITQVMLRKMLETLVQRLRAD
jgi:pyroglutamyl-peptidase